MPDESSDEPGRKQQADLQIQLSEADQLVVRLSDSWRLGAALPTPNDVLQQLVRQPGLRAVAYQSDALGDSDTGLSSLGDPGTRVEAMNRQLLRWSKDITAALQAAPETRWPGRGSRSACTGTSRGGRRG